MINITAGIIVYAYLVLIYFIQILITSLKVEMNGIMNTYHYWFMSTWLDSLLVKAGRGVTTSNLMDLCYYFYHL